jgi:hypothetical protein
MKFSQADSQVRLFKRNNFPQSDSLSFIRFLKSLGTQHVRCSCKDARQYVLLGRSNGLFPIGSRHSKKPRPDIAIYSGHPGCRLMSRHHVGEKEKENRFLKRKTLCWREKERDRYSLAETLTGLKKTTRTSALKASIPFCRYMTQV